MSVACPRHGLVDVAADAPCPVCGVPAYDLDVRGARDVVRQNRAFALKTRVMLCVVGRGRSACRRCWRRTTEHVPLYRHLGFAVIAEQG